MNSPTCSPTAGLLALALALLVLAAGCDLTQALTPAPGVPQYQEPALVGVPGGFVNAAGGNLLVTRVDLSMDTLLGVQEIRAIYNSASGVWLWRFQISYDGVTFVDPSGARHDVALLPDGAPVEGTVYTRASSNAIETRGGLRFGFDATGRLADVRWKTLDYPRLTYEFGVDSLGIGQCASALACTSVYTLALDANANPTSATDARTGRTALFSYDTLGRLVAARDALDVQEGWPGFRYEYTGVSLLSAMTSSEGERVEVAYQPGRRVRDVIQIGEGDPAHSFVYTAPSGGAYRTTHTNPLGGRTRFHYDAARRVSRVERLDDSEETLTTWSGLRPAFVTRPGGVTTAFAWSDDEITRVDQPSGNAIRFTYAPAAVNLGNPVARPVATIDDDLGSVEARTYDGAGRLESIVDGAGEVTSLGWNGAVLASFSGPSGASWTFSNHGVHGHWLELGGATTDQRAFDPVGNAVAASAGRQEGGVLYRGHDADRNLHQITVAATSAGSVTATDEVRVERASDGRVLRVLRPRSADHEFVHDPLGRSVERRERSGGVWHATQFSYDASGNLVSRTRPNGMREEFDHDPYGRVVAHRGLRHGVLEGTASWGWVDGRLASVYDSIRGETESYAYEVGGRLESIAWSNGDTVLLEYDVRSRVTRERLVASVEGTLLDLGYDYDLADRRIRVTDRVTGEVLVERVFDAGALVAEQTANGLSRVFAYDAATGQLVSAETTDALGAVVESTAVTFTAELAPPRQQLRATTSTTLATTTEEYWLGVAGSLGDPDQLVGKRVWHWNDGAAGSAEHVYDELSNRVDATGGEAFVYDDERTRLLQATLDGGATTLAYTYDDAGFVTDRAGVPITWTSTGRMASFGPAILEWDMRGRLVSFSAGLVSGTFERFGGRVESDSATGAPVAIDLGDFTVDLATGSRQFRHRDFRRNVGFVTDADGAVVSHVRYRPYGVDEVFGSAEDGVRFAGRREVGSVALLGARVYDPAVGRFLSPDPVFQLLNQYGYTLGNPVLYWDPDGAEASAIAIKAGIAVGSGLVFVSFFFPPVTLAGVAAGGLATKLAFAGSGVLFVFTTLDLLDSVFRPDPCDSACQSPPLPEPRFVPPSTGVLVFGPVPIPPPLGGCAPTNIAQSTPRLPLLMLLGAQLVLATRVARVVRRGTR